MLPLSCRTSNVNSAVRRGKARSSCGGHARPVLMPSLLIEWSSCQGGRLEFRYRNIPEIRARQPRSAGSRNYQIAFRIYLVSERILALPDATDRQQMHSARSEERRVGKECTSR